MSGRNSGTESYTWASFGSEIRPQSAQAIILAHPAPLIRLSLVKVYRYREKLSEITKRKIHSYEFKARVAPDAIRDELKLAELPNKYGLHSGMISTWKLAALDNMVSALTKRGSDPGPEIGTAEVEKLHSKIGQLEVERDFWADASRQFLGTQGKNGEQGS